MKACTQTREVAQLVRAGQWPQACPTELREHVTACAICADEAQMLSAFTIARSFSMLVTPPGNPGLLWWQAQLRRRHEAMERLERPAITIPAVTITASVVTLLVVLVFASKKLEWSGLLTMFASTGWNEWVVGAVAMLLCGFAVVALLVGFGVTENRQ